MTGRAGKATAWMCLLAIAACGSAARSGSGTGHRDLITTADIAATQHPSAYHAIQALRPHWLEVRGAASAGRRPVKRVYVDDLYFGEAEQLRQIPISSIEMIRYYDGPSATQRWGADHSAGAIQIISRRGREIEGYTPG